MLLWYASYGSNLDHDRFAVYLHGGRAAGAMRDSPGCRDQSAPADERLLHLPGGLRFGWRSQTWGGGVAFYDPGVAGEVLARAYLVTAGQLADITAQEMWRDPDGDLDLAEVLATGRQEIGPGHYETLHRVGEIDGHPVLTFTAPEPGALGETTPAAAYLRTMLRGLLQGHELGVAEAADYLAGWPGATPWTAGQIAALADADPRHPAAGAPSEEEIRWPGDGAPATLPR